MVAICPESKFDTMGHVPRYDGWGLPIISRLLVDYFPPSPKPLPHFVRDRLQNISNLAISLVGNYVIQNMIGRSKVRSCFTWARGPIRSAVGRRRRGRPLTDLRAIYRSLNLDIIWRSFLKKLQKCLLSWIVYLREDPWDHP